MRKQITFFNNLDEIPKVNEFIEQISQELNLPMTTSMNINLAIEEAVANVIMYAYPAGEKNEIHLYVTSSNNEITFLLTDSGAPFDPTLQQDPDITLSAEERPIGGLGIMLIKKIMNSVSYEYLNGSNQLTMKRKI